MAELVPHTYANSLFEVALKNKVDEAISLELLQLSEIIAQNSGYIRLFGAPSIGILEKHKLIDEAFSSKLSDYTVNTMKILVDNGRFSMLPQIIAEYQHIYDTHCGIMSITAVTVFPLDDALKAKLITKLNAVTGKKVRLNCEIDKSIIGGVKLKYDNTEIDASVKSRFEELRQNIKQLTI